MIRIRSEFGPLVYAMSKDQAKVLEEPSKCCACDGTPDIWYWVPTLDRWFCSKCFDAWELCGKVYTSARTASQGDSQ